MEKIIKMFKEIPEKEKIEENILSITGFPHYEKVSSNILKFFLDKNREHNLYDLFLLSIFNIIGIEEDNSNYEFNVETEVQTNTGKYIDILISNDEISIVIENKIFAELYNDLNNYYCFVAKKCKKTYGIVLSLSKIDIDNVNFKNITYEELFTEIEKNITNYVYNCNNKYLIFLFDYIKNTRELKRSSIMDKEFIDFVRNNEKDVLNMNKKLKSMHDDLRNTIKKLNNIVNEKYEEIDLKLWQWRELPYFYDISVTDIFIGEINITFHSILNLNGWEFEIWERTRTNQNEKIINMLEKEKIEYIERNNRFVFENHLDFNTDLEILAKYIISIVKMVKKYITI